MSNQDQPFFKPPNYPHRGRMQSREYNLNFKDIKLNLKRLMEESNSNRELLEDNLVNLMQTRRDLIKKIEYLHKKLNQIREVN